MELLIKGGKDNRSIKAYVQTIAKKLIDKSASSFKAYKVIDNNMNKLITIAEIIKRGVNDIQCDYSIGTEIVKGKKASFIKAALYLPLAYDKEAVNIQLLKLITSDNKRAPVGKTDNTGKANEEQCLINLDLFLSPDN